MINMHQQGDLVMDCFRKFVCLLKVIVRFSKKEKYLLKVTLLKQEIVF